ncbi:hypothetical protein [Anaerotruncus rubiinfantis]|uniref:hypothetical protein n=1 Tax=Anaerotruncus rubiinfantis TaxID=1720200 RepID=UPI003D7B50D9
MQNFFIDKYFVFSYYGYHFSPVYRLPDGLNTFHNLSKHLYSDHALGMCNYDFDWKKHGYSHDGFYRACGSRKSDLFFCWETKQLYIPGEHELFGYNPAGIHEIETLLEKLRRMQLWPDITI